VPDGDVHEFCSKYNLGSETEAALEGLGFQIGDDLEILPKEVYEGAGFTFLSWQQVLKAYGKYKHHLKTHVTL
jgi:hypothetical protein